MSLDFSIYNFPPNDLLDLIREGAEWEVTFRTEPGGIYVTVHFHGSDVIAAEGFKAGSPLAEGYEFEPHPALITALREIMLSISKLPTEWLSTHYFELSPNYWWIAGHEPRVGWSMWPKD